MKKILLVTALCLPFGGCVSFGDGLNTFASIVSSPAVGTLIGAGEATLTAVACAIAQGAGSGNAKGLYVGSNAACRALGGTPSGLVTVPASAVTVVQ